MGTEQVVDNTMARGRMQSTSCFVNLIQLLIVATGIVLASSCLARTTNQTTPSPEDVAAASSSSSRLAVAISKLQNASTTTTTLKPNRIGISSQTSDSTTPQPLDQRGLNRFKSHEQSNRHQQQQVITNNRRRQRDQDYGSDPQSEFQPSQRETIDGVVQVRRVARNVKRKLDQLTDRMSQIQSVIAQDHNSGDLSGDKLRAQARQDDDNAESNGISGSSETGTTDGGDQATGSASNQNQHSNTQQQQQQWSAAASSTNDEAQSNGDNGAATDQSVQDQDQVSTGDGNASNKHQAEQINSLASNQYQAVSSSGEQARSAPQRWSTPVIRSVIPGRSLDLVQDPTPLDSQKSSPSNNSNDNDSNDNNLDNKNSGAQEGGSLNSLDSQASPSVGDSSTLDQSIGGGAGNSSTVRQRHQASEPSMMHAEWSPNENYQYFSELNMKNHGTALGGATSGSDDLQRIASNRLASPQPLVAAASVGKFQNMTILNSDTDLANSYSMSGPQLSPTNPIASGSGGATNTAPPPTSTRRPTSGGSESSDQSSSSSAQNNEQKPQTAKKNNSVHTYSAANYGKSARDQQQQQNHNRATGQPHYVSLSSSPTSDSWSPAQQMAPSNHQTGPLGGSDGAMMNETSQQQQQLYQIDDHEHDNRDQIRWPTLATPAPAPQLAPKTSYASANSDQSDQIGLPPSVSNNLQANRYSSVMMPASLAAVEQRHRHRHQDQQQHREQPSRRLHRTSDLNRRHHQVATFGDQNNRGGDEDSSPKQTLDEPNESPVLSAHKYSLELPSEQSQSSGAFGASADDGNNSRRRSLEARRQLTTTTDTTLYESQHQLQQPAQQSSAVDTYSSRVDSMSPALTQLVDSGAMNASATTVAPTLLSAPQDHLKHRSSSGSLAMDDQQLVGSLYSGSSGTGVGSNYPQSSDSPTLSSSSSGLDGQQNYNQHQSGYYAQASPYYGLTAAAASEAGQSLPASYYSAPSELPPSHQHNQNQTSMDGGNQLQQQQQTAGYSPQPSYSSMRPGAEQTGQADSDGVDERQQALMSQLDNMANSGAPSDVQQYGSLSRPSSAYPHQSAYVGTQFYAPTSIQDTIHQATLAASNTNEAPLLARQQQQQQQLRREAQVSQTIADYNAYVRQYQQRQRALATQLALQQQQQQQQQQAISAVGQSSHSQRPLQFSPSIARSYYMPTVSNGGGSSSSGSSAGGGAIDQQQAESVTSGLAAVLQNNMLKRYSPETLLANYLTARSSQSSGGTVVDSPASASQYYYSQLPQSGASATSSQQAYAYATPTNYNNQATLRAALAQLAYQRLLAQVAAASSSSSSGQQQQQHLLSTPSSSSPYLANLQSSLASLAQQQQLQQSTASSGGASSNMYATAAMPQPVFYEAPASFTSGSPTSGVTSGASSQQAVAQMIRPSQIDGSMSSSYGSSSASTSTRTNVPSWSPIPVSSISAGTTASSSASSVPSANRRNYLTGLFKPSATSRYYYGPTILSPISLASPTALHAIYTPTSSASTGATDSGASAYGPSTALGHYYTNPYAFAAAAMAAQATQPHLSYQHAGSYQDPQSMAALAAQQYQQAMAAAAAAAAANSMQQHYLSNGGSGLTGAGGTQSSDTDMAESSMVPSDSAGSFASPPDSSNGGDSSGNDSNSPSSSSSKFAGGSMKQWLTVASLLAGILPMGLVMASMLPMLTVAGRKKRQLDFSARNFSDIYNSWQPSAILKAIMSASNESIGFANATKLLNELTALGDKSARPASSNRLSKSHHQLEATTNRTSNTSTKSARVLGLSASPTPSAPTSRGQQHHLQWPNLPFIRPLLTGTSSSNSTAADSSSSTTLNLPLQSTTPMPAVAAPATSGTSGTSTGGGNHQTQPPPPPMPLMPVLALPHPIKTTMKKVYEKVNNFIVTAQKRKHRSSAMDSLWPAAMSSTTSGGPGGAGPSSFPSLIKNMFDLGDFKKYLSELVRAKLAATYQQQSLLNQFGSSSNNNLPIEQQQRQLPAASFGGQQKLSNFELPPAKGLASGQQQLTATSASGREGVDLDRTRYSTAPTISITSNSTGAPIEPVLQQSETQQQQQQTFGGDNLKRFAQLSAQIHILPPEVSNSTNTQRQHNEIEVTHKQQQGTKPSNPTEQDSVVHSEQKMIGTNVTSASTKDTGAASKTAQKRNSLIACLSKVLCDLATKLRKATSSAKGQASQSNGTVAATGQVVLPDEDKQMTGQILSQLIDHIQDADRETMIFGNDLRDYQKQRQWRPSVKLQEDKQDDSHPILMIQEAVLRGQCSAAFVCPDPYHFKRIFSELKWPKQ